MSFDYANLSPEKLSEIKLLESKLEVVLIAFDSKYKEEDNKYS
ncbi:hypothetical protein [Halobacillus sp. BBL2006]|nr:hypothetical protein [Halobacillus sp. BBL2006]